jgi:pimeloyl-ACP methyl ester carboxylesterase
MRSEIYRSGDPVPAHTDQVVGVHERALGVLDETRSRRIRMRSGRGVHVLELGEGPPVLLLHGSSTSSLSFMPLLARLRGVRAIAVDRPGFGLSEPVDVPRERFRDAAVEFVDEVLEELRLKPSAIVGSSMGGTFALWYALAHPERVRRLVLVGAAPLLPGTTPPVPLRVMSAPVVGDLLARVMKPSAKTVARFMAVMGEGDTIVRYPDLIDALVAEGNDPIASDANLAELRAIMTPVGFRSALRLHPDELRQLSVPTLLVWGDHDPVGTVDVAQANARLIPRSQLEVLPAGHVPWLGNPDRVSELLSSFCDSGRDG